MLTKFDLMMRNASPLKVDLIVLLILIVIGAADYLTGYETSLSLFYAIPVALSTWYTGKTMGLATSLTAGVIAYAVDISSDHVYSNQFIGVWNALMRVGISVLISHTIHKLHVSLERERRLASTDTISDLLNRRAFMEKLELTIRQSAQNKQVFTLCYIDMDDFKHINDQHGHHVGDAALRHVASVLRRCSRQTDYVSRFGGDEFLMLLPGTDLGKAQLIINRVKASLSASPSEDIPALRCSIGVVSFIKTPASPSDAIRQVDELMYDVKKSGKNAVVFYEDQ